MIGPLEQLPKRWSLALLATFVVVGAVWAGQISGLSSSNDGSHTALARAIWMRGQASIEPDIALTLGVDRARKDERWYSDRPPGTAFVAGPIIAAGARFDTWAYDKSVRNKGLIAPPGTDPYILTYAARSPRAPALAKRIGTGLASGVAAWMLGLVTLALGAGACWRARASETRALGPALLTATATLGLGSLLGPYSTMLFAHVTAALGIAGVLWCLLGAREESDRRRLFGAGAFGSLAVSADYSAAVLVAGLLLALLWGRWRDLALVAAGAVPLAAATAGYHWMAFGGPFRIGYDYQTNFEFARDRSATFSASPLTGLWQLLGWGRSGGGLLVLCPIWLLGAWGLVRRPGGWALLTACGSYALLLSTHQTPWGGAGEDHRYLIACYPVLMVGLCGLLADPPVRSGVLWPLVGIAFAASLRAWTHTANWRETRWVVSWWLVAAGGLLVSLACLGVALYRRRLLADPASC